MNSPEETKSGKSEEGFSVPSISLPKGGGAIRGMGEKFAANPVTGTGSMSVPIAVSPGRSGFGPYDPGRWDFREDPFSTYRAGFEVRTTRLCQRVLMFHHFPDEKGVGEKCLVRSTSDPNLRFVYLDGDGDADVLITENDALVWHASVAEEGLGPARRVCQALDEEKGPLLVFADGTQSIYLADLSGDGLTDLARIRNGEVCYWPNLGYGRFGAKVTMDYSPHFDNPDQFDQKRIRLADIDGTGTTDIIYLHRDGVRLYFNQSGNSWSEPQILKIFPRVDDLVSIVPADLLGNGTACLVWSSLLPGDTGRPMRYVNLMGRQKPHLLVKTINNLGAETRVHYEPSTKFYLKDKQDGRPWITRLPFPVHVVERVETFDHISCNRFDTHYAYHHGYFDGEEREFRGFGMVEQWDTEDYSITNKEVSYVFEW